jgi:phosphomannomutase
MMSVSGVRGVVGAGLTPDLVCQLAASFGTLVGGGTVVVGVLAGLTATGCNVVHLGIVPTPTVQLLVEELGAQGGIAVTASHNPPQWNAMKFISHHGTFLQKTQAEELFAIHREGRINWAEYDRMGTESTHHGAIDTHVEKVLGLPFIDAGAIRDAKLRVVVDALHGAAGPITDLLMRALGVDAEILYLEPTGRFPRVAEPLPENLTELSEKVRAIGADVGFALDPDGDRLALVDETGTPIGEDYTLPLAMAHVLRQRKGPVVSNYSTSLVFDAMAERFDCPVHRAPVGEANVVEVLQRTGAVIGGAGNGGVILPDVHLGRDAPVAMALVLSLLADERRSVSQIVDDLPRYVMAKEKFELGGSSGIEDLDAIAKTFPDAQIDRTDGVYFRWPDGFLHVRKSGTEPIVRVIGEAKSESQLLERIASMRSLIQAGS